jgi:hypothetical protein
MLNPDARPLQGNTAADFSAVKRDAARERLSSDETTNNVKHDALKAAATLQTKAKIGVDQFARGEALQREQEAALAASEAEGSATMGARRAAALGRDTGYSEGGQQQQRLVPESGAYARPGDVTLNMASPSGARQGMMMQQQPVAASPQAGGDALTSAASDAFGRRGSKSTAATRAIYGFNNLASGLPNFLSRALAGRTTVTSV